MINKACSSLTLSVFIKTKEIIYLSHKNYIETLLLFIIFYTMNTLAHYHTYCYINMYYTYRSPAMLDLMYLF